MATRKRSLLPILLFCVLLTLVVARVVAFLTPVPIAPQNAQSNIAANTSQNVEPDPTKVRVIAQLLPPNEAAIEQQTQLAPATCAKPEEKVEDVMRPTCGDGINLADYITPSCPGGSCGAIQGSSVTLTQAHIGDVRYEGVDLGNGYFKQKSNDIYFIYQHSGNGIGLLQDTIWGGGPANGFFTCEGTDQEAFYRVTDPSGKPGNHQYPAVANCGAENRNESKLKTFYKVNPDTGYDINNTANTDAFPDESLLKTCNVKGQTDIVTTNTDRMIFQGSAQCMGVTYDMIAMENTGGAGAGEVNMYCKGKGLCAFYQSLDYSKPENKPQNWAGKDLCKLSAGGSRANLPTYFEYNLQRQCGQTPVKVLNNFLDEYSVSCVPQASYILDIVRKTKCENVGCADWNTPGELRFSAGGTLFGLFRNESTILKRYNTMNGLRDKDRQESIEAYFTGKAKELPVDALHSNTTLTGPTQNAASLVLLDAYQSPLYKLSTLEQQCDLVFDKLRAVKELCAPFNRIEGEEASECAINQFLPNTSLRYTDMLDRMEDKRDKTGKTSLCYPLMNPGPGDQSGIELRNQILSVDPAMEVAYRPAFVVFATLVGNPEQKNPQFLAQGDDGNFWQVDYMEVKVPTFGSDFLNEKNNANASEKARPGDTYVDPLRATANLITPLSIQEKFIKEEENDRQAMRAKAATLPMPIDPGSGPVPPGDIIGLGQKPIKCRVGEGKYSETGCDNIAKALITFINSSYVLPATPGEGANGTNVTHAISPARGWLPASKCEIDEKSLYGNVELTQNPVEEKYRKAEQATTIGSKLEAVDVGEYQKKKDAYAEIHAVIPDMTATSAENFGHTQVFFVSPHNYTLLYAQSAFLSLLSLDQQKAYLTNPNFNSVLKTEGLDSFQSDEDKREYYTAKGSGEDGPLVPAPAAGDTSSADGPYQVSAKLDRKIDPETQSNESPLMWQVGGSIASIPTRLFTLLTTSLDDFNHKFTLGCTLPFATESWLLNNCTPVKSFDTNPPPDIPQTPKGDKCVAVKMADPTERAAARATIEANLAEQHLGSPTFAGWAAYFGIPADRQTSQHLFYNDCGGGQLCYKYILDQVDKTQINPYLAIAIALNESGGLYSAKPGFVGPHFGCGVGGEGTGGGQTVGDDTIENKLTCMINTLNHHIDESPDQALGTSGGYGYKNGSSNDNLVKIVGYLSKGEYPKACDTTGTTGTTTP